MLKIDWPDCVLVVLGALERAGHESWAVGGCVRDALLGREPHDWDVCTAATPGEMRGALTGFRLLDTGEKHGTLTAMVHGAPIEITTFRADGAYTDHRRPDGVSFVRSLREDLARRDFTVNAILRDALTGEIVDPFGGQADLRRGVLRAVPGDGFAEDPLRVLRGAQFAARFRLSPDAKTLEKMRTMKTDALSPARVLGEMKKAMASGAPDVFFDVLRRADALKPWFGELAALIGVPQPPRYHPEGDAYTHSMLVLHAAAQKKARALRPEAFVFAALTHDLGKAVSTARGEDGEWHACGHENTGVPLTRAMLGRLGVNREIIAYCENMCRLHMRAHVCYYRRAETGETNLLFDESVCPNDLALLAVCDTLGKGSASGGAAGEEAFLTGRVRVYEETAARGLPDGGMLLAAGMEPGPQLAEVLAAARRRALTGETAEEAVQNVLRKRQ